MVRNRYSRNLTGLSRVAEPEKMINRPTIVPIAGQNGQGLAQIGTDPYFGLKIDTTGLQTTSKVVLFDASQGYQLAENYTMPLALVIEGLTAPYQAILNDVAHAASYVDIIKMTVSDENVALTQYGRPMEIYESSKGSKPKLVQTLHPEMGVHEGQFQKGINTFAAQLLFTNRTALVYTQEPGIIVTLGFYQKAEIGRKQ